MTASRAAACLGGAILCAALAGCSRVSGLPEVPASVSARASGLDGLQSLAEESERLKRADCRSGRATPSDASPEDRASPEDPLEMACQALSLLAQDHRPEGIRALAGALEKRPADLVIGNAYRMAVYQLTRKSLAEKKARGERTPELPEFLRGEPLATLERTATRAPGREIRLQIALAYVDRMVLSPALEIKAPASIDSVHMFTAILEKDPYYVPALVGRGLNYLYRPRNLVWPEHPGPTPDAASRDLSLAAAVGAKVGGAPPRLKGLILAMLGDACAHEGRVGVARSWWVLARETSGDAGIRAEIGARMTWLDPEVPDRLEDRLEERMADMENPVGDLSFLWSHAKGPS